MISTSFTIDCINEDTLKILFLPSVKGSIEHPVKSNRNTHVASSELCRLMAGCCSHIQAVLPELVTDIVQSYDSVLIYLDTHIIPASDSISTIRRILHEQLHQTNPVREPRAITDIPVYYDNETGPDLCRIADLQGIDQQDVISLHTSKIYTVYSLGFAPGFAYMGFTDPRIACARHPEPRKRVLAGSVAIADQQTGIYPSSSPGGWNIIGRTPTRILIENDTQPAHSLYLPGDQVRFFSIDRSRFLSLGGCL